MCPRREQKVTQDLKTDRAVWLGLQGEKGTAVRGGKGTCQGGAPWGRIGDFMWLKSVCGDQVRQGGESRR